MPEKNGTAPKGQGSDTGRGGGGRSRGSGGQGQGCGFAAGPGGYCVCPTCGEKAAHQMGSPFKMRLVEIPQGLGHRRAYRTQHTGHCLPHCLRISRSTVS